MCEWRLSNRVLLLGPPIPGAGLTGGDSDAAGRGHARPSRRRPAGRSRHHAAHRRNAGRRLGPGAARTAAATPGGAGAERRQAVPGARGRRLRGMKLGACLFRARTTQSRVAPCTQPASRPPLPPPACRFPRAPPPPPQHFGTRAHAQSEGTGAGRADEARSARMTRMRTRMGRGRGGGGARQGG